MSPDPAVWAARAARMPAATADDLAKWRRLATAAKAVAAAPQEFVPLLKARKACSGAVAFPAGHYRPDSPFVLLMKRAGLWAAWSGVEREKMAADLGQLADEALAALDEAATAAERAPRPRADIDD